jgi:hypothetical protein
MESRSLSRIKAAKVLMAAFYSREDEKCKRIFVQNTFDLIHISQPKDLLNSYVSLSTVLTEITERK